MFDLTATITLSVTTIVIAASVLYLFWRLGEIVEDLARLKSAICAVQLPIKPSSAAAATALTLSSDGAIRKSYAQLPAIPDIAPAQTAANGLEAPTVAASPVFLSTTGSHTSPTGWENSHMNGSNPQVAVVVLAPQSHAGAV